MHNHIISLSLSLDCTYKCALQHFVGYLLRRRDGGADARTMILELWCISGGRQMPSEKFRPLSRSSYVMAFANYLIMSRLYNVQANFPFWVASTYPIAPEIQIDTNNCLNLPRIHHGVQINTRHSVRDDAAQRGSVRGTIS
jgi:hypothetical protein